MKFKLASIGILLALTAAPAAQAAEPQATLALPATTLTFSWAYVAEGIHAWKKQGLDLKVQFIRGLGAINAMFGGNVEFSVSSGPTIISATARGRKPRVIGVPVKSLLNEIVVSKAIAAKLGPHPSLAARAKALKGKIIAMDSVKSIEQAYAKYVLSLGHVDPKDVTFTPVAPQAMAPALKAGRIDAIASLPPWTTQAVDKAGGVRLVSSADGDLPALEPIMQTGLIARAGYCSKHKEICKKFAAGVQSALDVIHQHPDKAFALIKAKFKNMDPAALKTVFNAVRNASAKSLKGSDELMEKAQNLALIAGSIHESEKLKPATLHNIYTNAYLR